MGFTGITASIGENFRPVYTPATMVLSTAHKKTVHHGGSQGNSLEESGYAFFKDDDAILDSCGAGLVIEQLQRLIDRFVREPECAVVHGHHPAGFQVEEGFGGVGGIGMNVAELWRVVGPDGKQGEFGRKTASDLAESGEISGIPGVIDGVLAGGQNEAAVAAMRILQDARAPMTGGNMRHSKIRVPGTLPPVEFDDFREAKIGNQVRNVCGDNN